MGQLLVAGVTDNVAVRRLDLSNNKLSGTLPAGLFRFRMQVYLCNNLCILLEFSCPAVCLCSSICTGQQQDDHGISSCSAGHMLSRIIAVALQCQCHIILFGTLINVSAQTLHLLQELTLGYNGFTGPLPESVNLAQDLTVLDVTSNQLTGPLPTLLFSTRMRVSFATRESLHVSQQHCLPKLCLTSKQCLNAKALLGNRQNVDTQINACGL